MAAGLEIVNTSGKVIFGRGYRHFRCTQKVTRQVANGSYFILTTSNTPVIYVQKDNGMFQPKTGSFLNNPTVFIGAVSHGGFANFARSTPFSTANEFGRLYVFSPGAASGALISVTYYIFDTTFPSSASSRFGLQIFNAQGVCEFNATDGVMRVTGQVSVPASDGNLISIPSGRTWAAMISGVQYWQVGYQVWGPGLGNNGSMISRRGIYLFTGYGSNGGGGRPATRAIIIDVTGL